MTDESVADRPIDADPEVERLATVRAAYAALAPRIASGEPWPLAEDYGTGPEASWGPREVLAHLVEMLPYWLGELERVVEGDGAAPVPFGRIADDAVRIGMIGRERSLPLRVLFERIDAGIAAWEARLPTLTAVDRAKVGLHPRDGEMRVDAMPVRFVVGHLEGHAAQLETILADADR
jgi:DinB superfamily